MERVLLTHCAPTLAGLKCANLVRLTGPRAELEAAAQAWKATLAPRGVHVRTARWDGDSALLYLYREGHLRREWEKPGAADFLRRHGYDPGAAVQENVELLLRRIARRPLLSPRNRPVPGVSPGGRAGLYRELRQKLPPLRLLEGLWGPAGRAAVLRAV